ncbi:MAG: exodeoxyribonuclease III [Candidatus Nanopelagicales bacterium]
MRVATANVNGIRAAARKGGLIELAAQDADVITLQEVRATPAQLVEVLVEAGFSDWSVVAADCRTPGRNGVAVLSRTPVGSALMSLPGFDGDGRWIEATITVGDQALTVVSAYVPKGYTDDAQAMSRKLEFLYRMSERMGELSARGNPVLVTGDLNVARSELDLKNWRQRVGKSGFLPEERAVLDGWAADGWGDVVRDLSGDVPGPIPGGPSGDVAFDNDAGWRIDYVWATAALAGSATPLEHCVPRRGTPGGTTMPPWSGMVRLILGGAGSSAG